MTRWRLSSSEQMLANEWLTVERNSYDTNCAGAITDYYIVRRRPFVLVIAEADQGILLVRQYRPATEKAYLAVPAGYIEANEDVLPAARRELLEETSAEGTGLTLIGSLDPLPGYISSRASVVYCRCGTPPSREDVDEEVLGVECCPWVAVRKMILSGEIDEMQTVAALLMAKEWLRWNPL